MVLVTLSAITVLKRIFIFLCFISFFLPTSGQSDNTIELIAQSVYNSQVKDERKQRVISIVDSIRSTGNYKYRYQFLKRTIQIAESRNDTSTKTTCLNYLGNVYNSIGKYYEAVTVFQEAIQLVGKGNVKDGPALSNLYMNIGNSFYYLKDNDKSLLYYKKSLSELKKPGITNNTYKERFALVYNNLAIAYIEKGDFGTGKYYFLQALNIDKELKDSTRMYNVLLNIAGLYNTEHNYDTALVIYMRARKYFERQQLGEDLAYVDQSISDNYLKMLDYKKALQFGKMALKNVDTSDFNSLSNIYKSLAKSYFALNDFKNAYIYQQFYTTTQDSLNSAGVLSKIKENELLSDFSKMRFADSVSAEIKLQVSNTKIEEKRKQNYYLIAVLLVTMIAFGVIYNRFKVIKKQKEVISAQKLIVVEKQTEILESLKYAKRIQQAQMPTEKHIEKKLKDLKK